MVSFLNLIHDWFVIKLEIFLGSVILLKDIFILLLGLRGGSFGPLKWVIRVLHYATFGKVVTIFSAIAWNIRIIGHICSWWSRNIRISPISLVPLLLLSFFPLSFNKSQIIHHIQVIFLCSIQVIPFLIHFPKNVGCSPNQCLVLSHIIFLIHFHTFYQVLLDR